MILRTRETGGVQLAFPYNDASRGNRQDTKRNATAELAELGRGATGLTVLALLLALLSQRPPCELSSICKQSVNE